MTSPPPASTPAPRLFTPLPIGPVEARNRIVVGAHFTQFTEPTTPGEPGFYCCRYARYLGEFARGGHGDRGPGRGAPDHGVPDAEQRVRLGSGCGAGAPARRGRGARARRARL